MADRKENRKHLYYLNELSDYKVDSDDPDVRGWPVKDADNRTVGKVDNLLVSKEKERVLYLDIEVDKSIIEANHDPYGKSSSEVHEFINKDGENHLILPIGLARLNRDEKFVYSDKINHQTFAETKRMEKGYDVDRDYEVVVMESYKRDYDNDSNIGTGDTDSDITGSHTGTTNRESTLDDERRRIQQADSNRDRNLQDADSERIAGRSADRDNSLSDRDRNLTDRDRTDRDKTLTDTDRDRNLTDRDRADRDRSFADRDTGGTNRDRDSLTGRESGTYSGRDTGRIADNDSFYDRGEFDYERYRNRNRDDR